MALLGALEHGIYVEKEDDDECHGMSISQIHQYFGLDKDYSEISVEEEEQSQAEIVEDLDDEDSISDDEEWLASPSGSEDEEMEELDDPDIVWFIINSCVYIYQIKYRTLLRSSIMTRVIYTTSRLLSQSIHPHSKIDPNFIELL
jgi:hypothetical protein